MNKKISAGSGVQIIGAVFCPFGVGYYLSYFFRTINAVISENLSTELGLGPANLGLLTSFYLIAFACAQIPLGIALDRYGPRTVNGFLLMIAGVGATIFAFAQSFETLLLGRALIGLGVSAALVSACKANAIWFSADRIPLMNNLIGAFGALGALSATRPVELILQVVSWRDIFGYLAVTTVLIALVILTLVPEKREVRPAQQNASEQLESYKNIICDRYFWRVSLMYAFSGAAFVSYQTLWADPWLRDVAGLEQAERANYLLAIQAGFLLGLLITGMVADLLRKTRYQAVHVFGGGVFLLIGVQVLLAFGITSGLFAIWFLYGL
ncbi:MAG: MFS transporter, partial [Pseudomonadota bacterium]|nr:MFS transporter [Pseudomonadota bacterium]